MAIVSSVCLDCDQKGWVFAIMGPLVTLMAPSHHPIQHKAPIAKHRKKKPDQSEGPRLLAGHRQFLSLN